MFVRYFFLNGSLNYFPVIQFGKDAVNNNLDKIAAGSLMKCTVTFKKPFKNPPYVIGCWTDNSHALDYCDIIIIDIDNIKNTGFKAFTRTKITNVYQWNFHWIAIGQ